jgi:hypothetical protein
MATSMIFSSFIPLEMMNIIVAYLSRKDLCELDIAMSEKSDRRACFLESLVVYYEFIGTFQLQQGNQKEYEWMNSREIPILDLVIHTSFDRTYIGKPMKKAFKRNLKQLRVEGEVNDLEMTQLIEGCQHLERLEINALSLSISHISRCPLKVVLLSGSAGYFFRFNTTIEVLSLSNFNMWWKNHDHIPYRGVNYIHLTTIKLQSCTGVNNYGLQQIALYCVNLVHFEIGTKEYSNYLLEDVSDGVLCIIQTLCILKFVSVRNDLFDSEMMLKVALRGKLQEFDMIDKNRSNNNNITCVANVCKYNNLVALTVEPNPRIADECLGLIADYCQEGLQQLSISSGFTCELFLQNVNKPGNVAIRGIRFLTLPDIALTDNEFKGVSEAFIDLRYLVFSGKNITDIGLLPLVRSFPNLESMTINDAYKITGETGAWFLFLHTRVKLKYIQVTNLLAQSVETFMSERKFYHTGVMRDVEIVNLDMFENGRMINHASRYGYKSQYPLPGGYVSKFDKL